jgi:hypothetical protein
MLGKSSATRDVLFRSVSAPPKLSVPRVQPRDYLLRAFAEPLLGILACGCQPHQRRQQRVAVHRSKSLSRREYIRVGWGATLALLDVLLMLAHFATKASNGSTLARKIPRVKPRADSKGPLPAACGWDSTRHAGSAGAGVPLGGVACGVVNCDEQGPGVDVSRSDVGSATHELVVVRQRVSAIASE